MADIYIIGRMCLILLLQLPRIYFGDLKKNTIRQEEYNQVRSHKHVDFLENVQVGNDLKTQIIYLMGEKIIIIVWDLLQRHSHQQ